LSYLSKGPYLLLFLPTNRTYLGYHGETQLQTQFGGTKDCTAKSQIVRKKKKKKKKKRTQSAWIVARNPFWCDFPMFLAFVV
jgi:hypothetical protein